MDDRSAPQPPDAPRRAAAEAAQTPDPAPEPDGIDLAGLSIAGITRRRVGWAIAALIAVWILIVFARQVSEATGAATRAEQIGRDNQALAAEVASLEHELQLIERPQYISEQARAYGVGQPGEIAFSLDPRIGAPGPAAPGSSSGRVGATVEQRTPFDSWMSLLFGPGN